MKKRSNLRTIKSSVNIEILPDENWEEIAFMSIKGMVVQAHGLLGQMMGRPGEEKLRMAAEMLRAAADELVQDDETGAQDDEPTMV
jgi:hypothetical protein